MPTIDRPSFLSGLPREAVTTGVSDNSPIFRGYGRGDVASEAWDAIESTLIDWGLDPSQLEEEGMETPTSDTIRSAFELAVDVKKGGEFPPTRVVSDVRGGIVFELKRKVGLESVHVNPDKTYEHRLVVGNQIDRYYFVR